MSPSPDPIVEQLRKIRIEKGWSQQQVARRIGRKSCQTIYQWERVHSVSLSHLREWADALGFDLVLVKKEDRDAAS